VTSPPPPPTHVRESVAAATAALEQLEKSLRQGGFAEGAPAYEQMAEVLIAQRMFTDEADDEADARFEQLGLLARRIFELLHPYASAMRKLAVLAPDSSQSAATEAVLGQLERRGRRGASRSVLARVTRIRPMEVDRALASLVRDGKVVTRGGSTYYVAPHPRPRSTGSRT
jgi:hypothetical protein